MPSASLLSSRRLQPRERLGSASAELLGGGCSDDYDARGDARRSNERGHIDHGAGRWRCTVAGGIAGGAAAGTSGGGGSTIPTVYPSRTTSVEDRAGPGPRIHKDA